MDAMGEPTGPIGLPYGRGMGGGRDARASRASVRREMVDGRGMRVVWVFFIEAYVTIEAGAGKWKPCPDARPGLDVRTSGR
jgi:hypothetical protein